MYTTQSLTGLQRTSSSSVPSKCLVVVVVAMFCLYISRASSAQLLSPDKPPAQEPVVRFTFVGLKHGFENDSFARSTLENNLRQITKQPIVVDSLDSNGAVWHSASISQCQEPEVAALLAKIRPYGRDFTRDYKLYMGQDFEYPKRVDIDWLGPCENLGRKRSDPKLAQTTTPAAGQETTTTTTEMFTSPPTEPPPTETTTAAPVTSTTTTTAEEVELTSFSFVDFTTPVTPAPDVPTNTTTLDDAATSVTELFSFSSMATITTAAPVEVTSNSPVETTPPVTPAPDVPTSTTTLDDAASSTTELYSSSSPDSIFGPEVTKPQPATAGEYGKYVGLAAAFLACVAYLLCARAYKRQGVYVLHEEEQQQAAAISG